MKSIKSSNFRITILLLIPGTLWGVLYLVNEIILETIPPFTLTAMRNLIVIIPLVVMLYACGGRLTSTLSEWRPYIFLGLFNNSVPFVLIGWGQLYIDSGLTTILISLVPLFTVLLAHFFSYNERLNRKKALGIALGLLGVLVLVGPSALYGVALHLWAQLAIIAAALSYAVSAIYVRHHLQQQTQSVLNSILEATSSQFLVSIVFVLPLAFAIDRPWTLDPSLASVIGLFISSWVIMIGAILVYYYIINIIGASAASTTIYLIPINGVFWGALILSETVTWSAIVALLLILSGIAQVNKGAADSEFPRNDK